MVKHGFEPEPGAPPARELSKMRQETGRVEGVRTCEGTISLTNHIRGWPVARSLIANEDRMKDVEDKRRNGDV